MMRHTVKNWVALFAFCLLSVSALAQQGHSQDEKKAYLGDAEKGKALSNTCMACHGADGNSPIPMYPKIAGQGKPYLVKQLMDIRDGRREALPMAPFVSELSDHDIIDLATYYSQQTPQSGVAKKDLLELGQRIYRAGIAEKKIPACLACHGPSGKGIDLAKFPMLAGQHGDYVSAQLVLFSDDKRTNDGDTKIMRNIANRMHASEIKAVANYIQGLR